MSLLKIWDKISLIKENTEDSSAISAIITGTNVDDNFWNNFILVCNNQDGIASLLNVAPEKVATWPNKIQTYLKKSQEETHPDKVKNKLIPTGDVNNEEL